MLAWVLVRERLSVLVWHGIDLVLWQLGKHSAVGCTGRWLCEEVVAHSCLVEAIVFINPGKEGGVCGRDILPSFWVLVLLDTACERHRLLGVWSWTESELLSTCVEY